MTRHGSGDGAYTVAALVVIGVLALAGALIFGCTDKEGAQRVLESQGFTEIEITGWKPGACGEDWYATGFRAKSPTDVAVSGVVCKGLTFKRSTVRFE